MTKREIIDELLARRPSFSHRDAETIVNAIFDAVAQFRGDTPANDDMTAVAVKITV
jgi:serine phosphatase RsbU (regulator of sigma subunit)